MTMHDDFESRVKKSLAASVAVKQKLLDDVVCVSAIAQVSRILANAFQRGQKAILFGNGGSAADAQHIAAEFVGRFAFDRPALPALALSVNTSCLTAIGNDYGFERVFARQLSCFARARRRLADSPSHIPASSVSPRAACHAAR